LIIKPWCTCLWARLNVKLEFFCFKNEKTQHVAWIGYIYFLWPNSQVFHAFWGLLSSLSTSLARVHKLNSSYNPITSYPNHISLLTNSFARFGSMCTGHELRCTKSWHGCHAIFIFEAFKILHLMWNCAPITNTDLFLKN
jgi:hypothetical protein